MNQKTSPGPAIEPDLTELNERVADTVRSHQRRLRMLTGIASLFGLLSMGASILIVACYFVFYLPKQKQILADYGISAQRVAANLSPDTADEQTRLRLHLSEVQATMLQVVSFGSMLVAAAVGLLAAGILLLLLLLVLQRRATLAQIGANLALISAQLKELQPKTERRSA